MTTSDYSQSGMGFRPESRTLDSILGRAIPVLDDGFVRPVDYLGNDSAIAQAARVSYGAGTKRVSDDEHLIRYLMRHAHTTPFEMCEIKLHVRVPMDCWRQWIRHRTANVNEYSTRYSNAIEAAQGTSVDGWRIQSGSKRQGSGDCLEPNIGKHLTAGERELQDRARATYSRRLAAGVAREQARKDLPLSTYTEAYWKIDLHNLFHFLRLRMDSHAQYEIRQYANAIGNQIVSEWCPIAWKAFRDYRVESLALSGPELDIMRNIVNGDAGAAMTRAESLGFVSRTSDGDLKRSRERSEFDAKLRLLGLPAPWAVDGDQ